MDEFVEHLVGVINETCETVSENFGTSGDFGDFCADLLRDEKFFQWEFFRTLHGDLKEFEQSFRKKNGNECVYCQVGCQYGRKERMDGLINFLNLPQHSDAGVLALEIKNEKSSEDSLLRSVHRLQKQLRQKETVGGFILWVGTSEYTSGEKLDSVFRDLREKLGSAGGNHDMWLDLKRADLELQFHLCPSGSKLACSLWKVVLLNDGRRLSKFDSCVADD